MLMAAKRFMPDVDFIIDIGGQDMKCFKIKQGVIDTIFFKARRQALVWFAAVI